HSPCALRLPTAGAPFPRTPRVPPPARPAPRPSGYRPRTSRPATRARTRTREVGSDVFSARPQVPRCAPCSCLHPLPHPTGACSLISNGTSVPDWDLEQLEVILEAPAAWQLVIAGPGAGKSAVACQRVAYLVD